MLQKNILTKDGFIRFREVWDASKGFDLELSKVLWRIILETEEEFVLNEAINMLQKLHKDEMESCL
jgi:hypothetical protein